MMDVVARHGPLAVLIVFFMIFIAFAVWAYKPQNKNKMEDYGQIPLKESPNGDE